MRYHCVGVSLFAVRPDQLHGHHRIKVNVESDANLLQCGPTGTASTALPFGTRGQVGFDTKKPSMIPDVCPMPALHVCGSQGFYHRSIRECESNREGIVPQTLGGRLKSVAKMKGRRPAQAICPTHCSLCRGVELLYSPLSPPDPWQSALLV